MIKREKDYLLIWKDLLDLGINSALSSLRERKDEKSSWKELKASLYRQSEEHWKELCKALRRLK